MRNKPCLLLVHGWGFSASFWQKMQDNLPYDVTVYGFDLDFIEDEAKQVVDLQAILAEQENIVAVGHSLGFLYLLQHFPLKFRHYIGINSFARFSRSEDFTSGISTRVLDRMAKGLEKDGQKVLKDFYQQCGCSVPVLSKVNLESLRKGLEILKSGDERQSIPVIKDRLTIIASIQDPVVSAEMTRDSFENNVTIHWIKDNQHVLPLTHSEQCAELIKDIL